MPRMEAPVFQSDRRFTQRQFKHWLRTVPPDDLYHYELLDGFIVMEPPAGWEHGESIGGMLFHGLSIAGTVMRQQYSIFIGAEVRCCARLAE